MSGVRGRRAAAALSVAGIAAALVLAGCGGGSDNASSTSGGDAAAPAAGWDAGAGPANERAAVPDEQKAVAPGVDQPAKAPADLRVDQRSIIYTGSVTVRVDGVNEAAARATAIVTGAGGFVGSDKRESGTEGGQATLELRVPAAKFGSVVDQLAKLGTEEQRGIDTQDVTEETLDLDARLASQKARVDSGRRLLAQAKSLSDLVMLESELAKREADLASLEAKKRRLSDLTALSTVTAVLLDKGVAAPGDEDPAGFLGGLAAGWDALVASLRVLLTVLGAVLPWLVVFGLPILAVVWLVRRSRNRGQPATIMAPAPAAPQD